MFSKKRAEEPQSPTAAKPQGRTMAGNSTFSVIGADVTIKGDVTASADLHVDGRVEGDIHCASLVQGESSTIEGSIEAEVARLSGRVTGSIHARELVILVPIVAVIGWITQRAAGSGITEQPEDDRENRKRDRG